MNRPLIELRGITKRFGSVVALNKVNFSVNNSEVVGLVGDNGAGKSTLAKIMVGYFQPDDGEIYFEGRRVTIPSPAHARSLGIDIVYQDLALVPYLSVYQNLFLNREVYRRIGLVEMLDKKKMKMMARKFLDDIGLGEREPDTVVCKLSGGEKQSIAIARTVFFGVRLVILDEPTSALSVKESERVLNMIGELKSRGVSSVVISHNIYHVYSVADRIVVLDRGRKVLDIPKQYVTPEEVIEVIAHRLDPGRLMVRV